VRYLHAIANGQIRSDEAVRAYHGELQKLGIKPYRALKDDMELTSTATSYAGSGANVSLAPAPIKTAVKPQADVKTAVIPKPSAASPDFKSMTSAQKVALARARIKDDLAKHSYQRERSIAC
jgi:hypothetical protein